MFCTFFFIVNIAKCTNYMFYGVKRVKRYVNASGKNQSYENLCEYKRVYSRK